MKRLLTTLGLLFVAVALTAQPKESENKEVSQSKGPAEMAKFIKPAAKVKRGMTTLYQQDNRYYININDTLFGRDIRVVSRIVKGAEGIRNGFDGYAGDVVNSAVVRFEKGENDKIYLKYIANRERSAKLMTENVANSNFPAIVAAFDIKANSSDKSDNIIDVTDFLLSDSEYLFFTKRGKQSFNLTSLQKDKSYISSVRTYPINTEFSVVYTYGRSTGVPTATYELNASFVLLPKVPMTPRYADSRVGYFTVGYVDFDRNPQKVEQTRLITRWRLEPKPEDIEKYKRGELVEPAKPIVFYIDPATPKQWVPYLIQGVNDWQGAFEKAGFKNAIYALEAPTFEEDSTWSLEDARHSAIVYKPSDIPNAMGPHINDPRSGEIIESHICWYHNVMSLVSKWYFIQCSPVDPEARKMIFDEKIMGELVRFVSSHEVGHTLGLRHNFLASAIYTPEQLRDVDFVRENGNATSIMDYARFNYVAQPGDNIPREYLYPRINHYDKWAIEWGYRRFPDIDDPEAEREKINNWIIEKTKDPYLKFGTESNPSDPRFQSEDMGNNQMISNDYGIKNLQYILKHLIDWTSEPNESYENLREYYGEVVGQYSRYIMHVAKWIGGVYYDTKYVEEPGAVYTPVPKEKQREALEFLKKHLFSAPLWLVPDDILNKISTRADMTIEGVYNKAFAGILSKRVMLNLYNDEIVNGNKSYSIENLYSDLNSIVWASVPSNKEKAIYHRLMQKCYVRALLNLYASLNAPVSRSGGDAPRDNTDVVSMTYYQLVSLKNKLVGMSDSSLNGAHYSYLGELIDNTLNEYKKGK